MSFDTYQTHMKSPPFDVCLQNDSFYVVFDTHLTQFTYVPFDACLQNPFEERNVHILTLNGLPRLIQL
jgi:hypothetical protein